MTETSPLAATNCACAAASGEVSGIIVSFTSALVCHLRRKPARHSLTPDQLHELHARAGVGLETAAHRAAQGRAVLLLASAHHHAKVPGLYHHADAARFQNLHQTVGDLRSPALLHLQPAREDVDDARDLAKPDDLAVRHITDMHPPEEWQHVMFALRVKFDVLHQHHLVAVVGKDGALHYVACGLVVTAGEKAECGGGALRRAVGTLTIRSLA